MLTLTPEREAAIKKEINGRVDECIAELETILRTHCIDVSFDTPLSSTKVTQEQWDEFRKKYSDFVESYRGVLSNTLGPKGPKLVGLWH